MDNSHLLPALDRLMADNETAFSPADAVLLRDTLPVQPLISLNFNISGVQRQENKGPVKVGRYHLLHTCQLITSNSVISISLEPEGSSPARTARIVFVQDTPISLDLYGKNPIDFCLGPIDVNLKVQSWTTWKTPATPPSPSAQTSEQAASGPLISW